MNRNPEIAPDGEDDDPPSARAAAKSRGIGYFLLAVAAAGLAGAVFGGAMPGELLFALVTLAAVAGWMGLGMVLFPWSAEMFERNRQNDMQKFLAALPVVWRAWFAGVMVVGLATLAGLIVWDQMGK